ncbi:kinase-like protein [Coniochaeta ligniaria NRRL 30616]|uniref:Kinase-like protein n=1 Tax=Coniochaeta ligniaria NRRL 30616 TaxID=1408157 RepID=A0A1J7I5W3_9PEZI|nr:kinase-like protein [Coniochaeta ligniaria NRRL 30616]
MATSEPIDILFCVPSDALPRPLPSPEDVESCPDVLQDSVSRRTVRVCDCYVVKHGVEVQPIEGKNMVFVKEHTEISVPRLFAVFQKPIRPGSEVLSTFIVMENIPGATLQSQWPVLTDDEKGSIARQLRNNLDMLREIPSPGYFGALGKEKLSDNVFWTDEDISSINGPFATSEELVNGLVQRYIRDGGERMLHKAAYYARVLPGIFQADRSVFTHNDLQPKNIIIRPDGKVAIVDWAAAGWYPPYWEYATAMFAVAAWKDDWHRYLGQILDEFPNQYAWLNALRAEMWG